MRENAVGGSAELTQNAAADTPPEFSVAGRYAFSLRNRVLSGYFQLLDLGFFCFQFGLGRAELGFRPALLAQDALVTNLLADGVNGFLSGGQVELEELAVAVDSTVRQLTMDERFSSETIGYSFGVSDLEGGGYSR